MYSAHLADLPPPVLIPVVPVVLGVVGAIAGGVAGDTFGEPTGAFGDAGLMVPCAAATSVDPIERCSGDNRDL